MMIAGVTATQGADSPLEKLFNKIDANQDGILTKAELQAFQQKLQTGGVNNPFLNNLLQEMEKNGSSSLSSSSSGQNVAAPKTSAFFHELFQFTEKQITLAAQGQGLYKLAKHLL